MIPVGIKCVHKGVDFDKITPKYDIYFTVPKTTKLPESFKDAPSEDGQYLVRLECLNALEEQGAQLSHDIPGFLFSHIDDMTDVKTASIDHVKSVIGDSIWDGLRPYQKVSLIRFVTQKGSLLIWDDMGTGKTIQGLACMYYWIESGQGDTVLLVCPSSLKYNWRNELLKWLPYTEDQIFMADKKDQMNPETKLIKRKFYRDRDYKIIIMSYGIATTVQQAGYPFEFNMLVCDESHSVKNQGSQRTKAVQALAKKTKSRVFMTGTPCSYPREMWTQINMLYPNLFPQFFDGREFKEKPGQLDTFSHRYCAPYMDKIYMWRDGAMRVVVNWEHKGSTRTDELNAVLRSMMVRRTKLDVLPDLPPKTRSCIMLPPLKKKHLKEIKETIDAENTTLNPEDETEKIKTSKALGQFTQSVRLTAKYKRDVMLDFVEKTVINDIMKNDPTRKPLLFCHSVETREALMALMDKHNIPWFTIHGTMSSEQKAQAADEFQNTDKYQVGILSILAAGVGFTLTKSNWVIFTELLYSFTDHGQAEDRVCRIGQTKESDIWYLIAKDTMDDQCMALIKRKYTTAAEVVDGKTSYLRTTKVTQDELAKLNRQDELANDNKKRKTPPVLFIKAPEKRVVFRFEMDDIPYC